MKIRGLHRGRRIVRKAVNLAFPHGIILMYHRVAVTDHDPWALAVSPAHFADHLEVLGRCAHVVPLNRLREETGTGSRKWPVVAITFDDGYADNLYAAKPLLERFDMPATLFAATGYIDSGRPFWSDQLVRIVLGAPSLPERLLLSIGGTLLDRAMPLPDEDTGNRLSLLLELWHALRPLPMEEQLHVLDALLRWTGECARMDSLGRPMTRAELARMATGGLVEIGAHTVTHCELPAMDAAARLREIAESKAACEALVGVPVTSFAYPYGRFDATTETCVRRSGFALACTTRAGMVRRNTGMLHLPRIAVRDWDGEEFERKFRLRFDA